jgi:hypothetical protein
MAQAFMRIASIKTASDPTIEQVAEDNQELDKFFNTPAEERYMDEDAKRQLVREER